MNNDNRGEQNPPREKRRDYYLFLILILAPCVGSILVGLLSRYSSQGVGNGFVFFVWVPLVCSLWAGRIAGRWTLPDQSGGFWQQTGRSAIIILICFCFVIVEYSLCAAGCSVVIR